jgi:hypothetical protein
MLHELMSGPMISAGSALNEANVASRKLMAGGTIENNYRPNCVISRMPS